MLKKLFCKHKNPLKFLNNVYGDMINVVDGRSLWECRECGKIIVKNYLFDEDYINTLIKNEEINNGKISDGYHTFNELYAHRMVLFSVICETYPEISWKSKLHSDETMFDDYFIVGITTLEGDYTYHYHISHWNRFEVKELDNAPEWDGHKPEDIERLYSILKGVSK